MTAKIIAQSVGCWERRASSASSVPVGPQDWLRVAALALRSVFVKGWNL